MKRFWIVSFVGLFFLNPVLQAQKIQSPDEFLGYTLGSRFTFYHHVMAYVNYVSEQSNRVELKQIGETYEGRPQVLLFISSAENVNQLETIRTNNLKRARIISGKADDQLPVVVWFSYNVHGNEASSTEAAMMTLYELATTNDAKKAEWLKNTVLIMDPCMNPDGRDRYVFAYQQQSGVFFNADPNSIEHDYGWASGRANHYFFDLNRDWAWTTQQESQSRIKEYQNWMPQIHVDFHEQGYNEPYFFAPAAEPIHEAVTPFQKSFLETIGKNNATYFDTNHWLFFTRQFFDLMYPSYGDTWPIFNGAIGMTYEQGGINAGLAVVTETGDTLKLSDRIRHHYTSGLATIETASLKKQELQKGFEDYFQKSISNPEGKFKAYILKKSESENFDALLSLLKNQGIQYKSLPENKTISGFNYFKNGNETYKSKKGDVLIEANQPKSTLLRVLFDPNPQLTDSLTYDITSWAMPWLYGVETLASTQKVTGGTDYLPEKRNGTLTNDKDVLAYIFRWDSFEDARFLSALFQNGVKARSSEKRLTVGGKAFTAGSILILKKDNPGTDLIEKLNRLSEEFNQELSPIYNGFIGKGVDLGSPDIHFITPPKVAILGNSPVSASGMGEAWHFFEHQLGYPASVIDVNRLSAKSLANYDVVVLPEGNYFSLSKNGVSSLQTWTKSGGVLIALGRANNWLASQTDFGSLEINKAKKAKTDSTETFKYEDRDRFYVSESIQGAYFKHDIDFSHPLGYGFENSVFTLHLQGTSFAKLSGGWSISMGKKGDYLSGFVGFKAKDRFDNALIYGTESFGRGSLVYLTESPLFRAFLYQNKLLMANAIFQVGQTR